MTIIFRRIRRAKGNSLMKVTKLKMERGISCSSRMCSVRVIFKDASLLSSFNHYKYNAKQEIGVMNS